MPSNNKLRSQYKLRQMVPTDYDQISSLGEDVHFDEGAHNIKLHHQTGGIDKFWVLENIETGEIVAYALTNAIGNEEYDFGYLIYVKESERGKGLTRLFPPCLGDAGFATSDNISHYDWPVFRQKLIGFVRFHDDAKIMEKINSPAGVTIEVINIQNLQEALSYDAHILPIDRKAFMAKYLLEPKKFATSVIARKNNAIVGLGALRTRVRCTNVAPIYADSPEVAEYIADYLISSHKKEIGLYIPFFANNITMMRYCNRLGMQLCDCTYSVSVLKQKMLRLLDGIDYSKVYSIIESMPI